MTLDTSPNSKCRVRVEIESTDGTGHGGEAEGTDTREGRLIAGASATLSALKGATQGSLQLEFRGAKVVRAFDASVIVVSLRTGTRDRRFDLIGACEAPGQDIARGVVLAVLDATNRILGHHTPRTDDPGGPHT